MSGRRQNFRLANCGSEIFILKLNKANISTIAGMSVKNVCGKESEVPEVGLEPTRRKLSKGF